MTKLHGFFNYQNMPLIMVISVVLCMLLNASCGVQYKNSDGTIDQQKIEETYDLITIDFANSVIPIITQILNEKLALGDITDIEYERAIAVMNVFTSQERAINSAEVVNASFQEIIKTFSSWFNLFNQTVLPLLSDVLEEVYPEKIIIIHSVELILKSAGYLI